MPPFNSQGNQPTPSQSSNNKQVLTIIVLLTALVGLAAFAGYNFYKKQKKVATETPTRTDAYFQNLKSDQTFQDAWKAETSGDYQKALTLLQTVQTKSPGEYSVVQYEIGNSLMNIDQKQGIAKFVDLSASSSINSITKAYAMYNIGATYMSTHNRDILLQLINEFKAKENENIDGINQIVNASTTQDTVIGLFELSSSYYPLADSEIQLAYAYSVKAYEAKQARDTVDFEKYKTLALNKIESGSKDLERTRTGENTHARYPLILNRKGLALGYLQQAGVTGIEDPAKSFEQGISELIITGVKLNPFSNYNYAGYLARIDKEGNKSKIQALMQPLVEQKDTPVMNTFLIYVGNAFKNNEIRNIADLKNIADAYPEFNEIIQKAKNQ